jgi:hypothetical protein
VEKNLRAEKIRLMEKARQKIYNQAGFEVYKSLLTKNTRAFELPADCLPLLPCQFGYGACSAPYLTKKKSQISKITF